MLGLVQLVLSEMLIEEAGGARLYEEVCRQAHIDPHAVFRLDRDYDDGQALKMFEATADVLGIELQKVLAVFADAFVRDSLTRFPVFFEMAANSREFLERQPKIHGCLAMAVRGDVGGDAASRKFEITPIAGGIQTRYRSRNCLAALYVALAERIIAHYEDQATVTVLDDIFAPDCRIEVVWHDGNILR